MPSDTQICNLALSLLGEVTIASYGDTDTKEGRFCKLLYEEVRDEVIAQSGVKFRCAVARSGPLAAVSNQPTFGWDYAYQLPTNPKCLRVIALVDEDGHDEPLEVEWTRQGDYILTDETTVYITYIAQVTDPMKLPAMLVKAIYTALAARLAIPLTGKLELAEKLEQKFYGIVNPEAVTANADDGPDPDEGGVTSWEDAGRS